MKRCNKAEISKEKQNEYISKLTDSLTTLRARAGISQGDIASVIGVSRQTYSSIECKRREMSWNTFLSLLVYFDFNNATHKIIRNLNIFPEDFVLEINDGEQGPYSGASGIAGIPESITDKLDAQALHAIRTVVMVEYARCMEMPGDEVVKAFDGTSIRQTLTELDTGTYMALRNIRNKK